MQYCSPIHYTGTAKIPLKKISPQSKTHLLNRKKEKFKDRLSVFLPMYGKDILNDFYRFWTELNPSQTKMRFEMEKTWQLDLRLIRWHKSNKTEKAKTDNNNFHISGPVQIDHR